MYGKWEVKMSTISLRLNKEKNAFYELYRRRISTTLLKKALTEKLKNMIYKL